MKLIAGSSSPQLSKKIAQRLSIPLVEADIEYFSNREKRIRIKDELRGENVCLVQSFVEPVDENIMEALLMVDALERLGVRHVSLVIPWMGYSLQDKVFQPGEPISAKVVANLVSNSYVKRVLLMDLHNDSIPAFFDIPTNYLSALNLFAQYITNQFNLEQTIIASPDFGGLKRARKLAQSLDLPLVNVDKERDLATGQVTAHKVHGNVEGKTVLVFDDVIVSGGTIVESAKLLKQSGAREVIFMATHGLLTNDAAKKVTASPVDQVVISNSIEHQNLPDKFEIIDVSSVFAKNLAKWMQA